MLILAYLLILFALFSCATPEPPRREQTGPAPVKREQNVPPSEPLKKGQFALGSVEGTVVRVEEGQLQVRRFKDNQVVVLRVRSTEGIYIGDRVQVTEGVVKKITAVRAKK